MPIRIRMAEEQDAKGSIPFKTISEGGKRLLVMDYGKVRYVPSIPENPIVMREVVLKLLEVKNVDKVVLVQKQEYVYDVDQTKMLYGVAGLYEDFVRAGDLLKHGSLVHELSEKYEELRRIVMSLLITDPIAAYVDISRIIRREELELKHYASPTPATNRKKYIEDLKTVADKIVELTIVQVSKPYLAGYDLGDRKIYDLTLAPTVRPYFIYTKVVTKYPTGADELDSYSLGDTDVTIFRLQDEVRPLYFVSPPEFKLSEKVYSLLGKAIEILARHKPSKEEFARPTRTREVFYSVEKDLLHDLAKSERVDLTAGEEKELTNILIRYTIGFGIIETLLSDPKIQDVVINAPAGASPIFVVHQDHGECKTNISATPREVASWATKLRLISGRPLDEANPVLDTNLVLPKARARVTVVQEPLSHQGIAFALRRHRSKPWTLPLFIQNKMLTPMAAGLLSFLADGGRTMIIAGTRSSGKTSLLGALMLEIMRKHRIITIEDTLELGTDYMRDIGYNIESMKVRSVITGTEREIGAAEGIRTSLRMGDSALIIGEVRSTEAKALYEAMRVGALAHVVAGTIHGDSPYSVFDRVVNDLGVPITSFKATDIIAVANPVRTASGLSAQKRLVQLSEVRKFWTKDPLEENGFADLLTYDAKTDKLEPTSILSEGESEVLKNVASRVKEWVGNWPAAWDNILLRARTKEELVKLATTTKKQSILEAPFVVRANDEFHRISEDIYKEIGSTDPKRVLANWLAFVKKEAK